VFWLNQLRLGKDYTGKVGCFLLLETLSRSEYRIGPGVQSG